MIFFRLRSNKRRLTVFLLTFILISSLTNNIIPFENIIDNASLNSYNDDSDTIIQSEDEDLTFFGDLNLNMPKFNQKVVNNWKEKIQKADQNGNGINDQFEFKLNSINENEDESTFSTEKINEELINQGKDNQYKLSFNRIPVIVQFPFEDYSYATRIFRDMGGRIKTDYQYAINGFAGEIENNGLNHFREILINENFPFLIEEDIIVKANLYYASRNMNLRPYVWNNLSYDGDEYSSIAIIDTGIDDSHNFFPSGYSNGNFNFKIVGWRDEVNGYSMPYDDNGHGSHCAGIATGEGNPDLDAEGRPVSTYAFAFDDTGDYWEDDDDFEIIAAVFNVTNAGDIEIVCNFNDFTPGIDQVHIYPNLYYGDTIVASYQSMANSWTYTLDYPVPTDSLGIYTLILEIDFDDNNGDEEIWDPYMRINTQIHWPFDPPLFESGDPWKGIAPDTHLVGVKVLDEHGSGYASDIIDGIDWVIANKDLYNITVISMSLGGMAGYVSMIDAVNNAVENGIVTVVSAGNSGGSLYNRIGTPGDADNVITVGAISNIDRLTEYSSSGGPSYTEFTIKPDILAPGGSWINLTMFSTDTNDNDAEGEYPTDSYPNDMYPAVGTSMATPAVAGAASLLIEAMGGHKNWNYSSIEAKLVKALLLMTATETYPLTREENPTYSPELNRGTKDRQEGYGRINVDAAIEALTKELVPNSNITNFLTSSTIDPFSKHALGCYVKLNGSENYKFTLDVPSGVDFDLFLYNTSGSSIGEPVILAYSNSSILGQEEFFSFTPTQAGKYYLVAKAVQGEGLANISFLLNNFAPSLIGGSVYAFFPANQSTLLNFTVIYTDPDNMEPTYVKVLINGTPYIMSQQDLSDKDYSDGCLYQYLTYLQPGNYEYSFEAKDGRFSSSTSVFTGLNIIKTNLFTPTMNMAKVSPNKGLKNVTPFLYTINYTDLDNNAPIFLNITVNSINYTMTKKNPLDVNYMDGCIYTFEVIFNESWFYNYSFYCFDSDNYVLSVPYYGPTVCSTKVIFQDDFESGLSKWESVSGLWQLTDDSSSWPDPYHSPTHSMWHGQEGSGTYNTGGWTYGMLVSNPINLSNEDNAYLEFYHWREGDQIADLSIVCITTDMEDYDFVYIEDRNIEPWEKVSLNLSDYCGSDTVWILFYFDNLYYFFPGNDDYRGWLIDDITVYSWMEPNKFAPELSSEDLTPYTGNQTTQLNFSVIYTDKDNNPPSYVNVVINNTTYPMQKVHTFDSTYYDGCQYQTLIYLQPGTYNYTFKCADYKYTNSTKTYTDLTITEHPNNNAPILSDGRVNPMFGGQGETYFTFSVIYSDINNNAPESLNVTINSTVYPMIQKDKLDTNYMDGCKFIIITTLNELGNYTFHFNCTDGIFESSDGPYFGPTVNKWYGLINYKMISGYSYDWIDATPSNGGIRCDMDDEDDEAQSFHLPFKFRFYDQYFDTIYICTNGFASFVYETEWYNEPFPTSYCDLMIAPFWTDLEANDPFNIYVLNLTNPNRVVIAWLNIEYLGGPEAGSFEVILYENGDIIFNYDNITYIDDWEGYTCGLNYGLDTSFYNMFTGLYAGMDNFSILFRYEPSETFISGGNGDGNGDGNGEDDMVIILLIISASSIGGIVAVITIIIIKRRKSGFSRGMS